MRRALPSLAVALLLIVPAAQAASPGARNPITVDAGVTDVAASSNRFLAGTTDAGSKATNTPSQTVWNLWNSDGSLRGSGTADWPGCPGAASGRPAETCTWSVRVLGISSDGTKLAVGATQGSGSSATSLVATFADNGVRQGTAFLTGPIKSGSFTQANRDITDLAFDPAGNHVAVVGRQQADPTANPPDTTPDGFFGLYSYAGTGNPPLLTEELAPAANTFGVAATSVDTNNGMTVVGAGGHHRFLGSGVNDYHYEGIQGNVLSVDLSASSKHFSVAGYDSGFYAVFASTNSAVAYQKREAGETSAANAVAIRDDATAFAVGHAGGHLRLYSLDNDDTNPGVALLSDKSGLGTIQKMAFSADGHYLAVLSSGTLRVYYTGNGVLEEMWSDARTFANTVAIDARGEHVVAAVGATVIVYDAKHTITPLLPTASQQPGTEATYTVTYRNDGNREDSLALATTQPSGVDVKLDPPQFTLAPGAAKNVAVKVTVPATFAPSNLGVVITDTINGGADGTPSSTLTITVPTVHHITLDAGGADSKGASHGGPATFTVMVGNAGNVAETVALHLDGVPADWTSAVDPPTLSLAPATFGNVTVTLQPPATAADGTRVTATLKDGGVASLELTATVGASFAVGLTGPVGVTLSPGVSGSFNVTVRNRGNTLDSVSVKISALPSGWQGGFLNGQDEFDVPDLERDGTQTVQVTIRVPEDYSSSVPVQLTITAHSLGDATKTASARPLITVASPTTTSASQSSTKAKGNGIPGPAPELLLLGMALAAVAMRRRR